MENLKSGERFFEEKLLDDRNRYGLDCCFRSHELLLGNGWPHWREIPWRLNL